jgi:predicted AlkP superfamily pyrophosphatase or phosphodiesterase
MQRCVTFILGILLSSIPLGAQPQPKPVPQIERVLIISIDGLRPDLLLRGDTPNLRKLYEGGCYTFWARTTAASTTLPSHVSMLTGVVPEVHAIMWNADLPLAEPVYPLAPTLFELAKKRGYTTAIASGKSKFSLLGRPGTLDWSYFPSTVTSEDPEVIANAERLIRAHRPQVMVVHLPSVDNAGHAKGWGSPQQMEAIAGADACVGRLLAALDELGLRDSTMVLVTADHGGAGRTHGPEDARSRTIPWIVSGPGIKKGFDLTRLQDSEVETYDTFTTCCTMLGIPIERRVRGKFISQILEHQELVQPAAPAREPGAIPATQPARP